MDAGIKLCAVRFYKNTQNADVLVMDGETPRIVNYEWHTQKPGPMPDTWWSAVCGEVEYQRIEERKKEEKTWVPQM